MNRTSFPLAAALLAALAFSVVGCSGDDTNPVTPSPVDSGAKDVTVGDAHEADTSAPDVVTVDAHPDTGADAGTDAPTEASTPDGATDGGDASTPDAAPDAADAAGE